MINLQTMTQCAVYGQRKRQIQRRVVEVDLSALEYNELREESKKDADDSQAETDDGDNESRDTPSISDIPGPWSKLDVTRNARVIRVGASEESYALELV